MILSFMVRHEVDEGRTKGVAVSFATHLAARVAVAAARPMVSTLVTDHHGHEPTVAVAWARNNEHNVLVLSHEDDLPRSKFVNDEEDDGDKKLEPHLVSTLF
ncbi:hypothetical protein Tco_0840139 [Tanacetum coccineum]|uniref:Uncharacterized protein n=1 Tax=Tanacetum coccineum TaxID=301880 RepID=A0ABQ5AVD3_9ASTR